MKDNYDFSDAAKNPFAKKLKKKGHTVVIHYAPKEIPADKKNAAEIEAGAEKGRAEIARIRSERAISVKP